MTFSSSFPLIAGSVALALLATVTATSASEGHDADHHAGHDGHAHHHEHGVGHLDVRLSGYILSTSFTLPGGTFYGDLPRDERSAEKAESMIGSADQLFATPTAAQCIEVNSALDIREIKEGDHAGHKDFTLRHIRVCDNPAAITEVALDAFATFPKLNAVHFHWEGRAFELKLEATSDTGPIDVTPPFGQEGY